MRYHVYVTTNGAAKTVLTCESGETAREVFLRLVPTFRKVTLCRRWANSEEREILLEYEGPERVGGPLPLLEHPEEAYRNGIRIGYWPSEDVT